MRWIRFRIHVALALLAVGLALPATGRAQAFYSFPGARPVPDSSPALGATVGFGDHFFRLLGFGRFNISQRSDLGLELAYDDLNSSNGSNNDSGRFGGGADFKMQVVRQDERTPVDVAVQVGAGVLTRSQDTQVRVPFGAVASRTFPLEEGKEVVPYGGIYLVVDYINHDNPRLSDGSDLNVEGRFGASVRIVRRTSVFASLHVGDGTMFFLGFFAGL